MKNQGIVAPPKETNEVLIMDPEKMKIYQMPYKKFKNNSLQEFQ
jgi:hypothetical protein